ncbi:hypothetical protein QF026_004650 [Streptomyces aurantiacus]|uniref:DUF397 domain-containing protein n=1 Tax=Streptomyces aurantiacus TaxID=47760 RepID=UPI00278F9F42|nr:DUF397 domain-containing protein [Streptomyces aurantiacus]MDQ0776184.1 hypothetical protein [Streptomyces aurantiacus]
MTDFELSWQKSTFSGGPQGECLYIAAAPNGVIHLRESDTPGVILTTAPQSLAAFLRHTRSTTTVGFPVP